MNEGKTFPVEKIVMKTVLNTISLYYSILRVLGIGSENLFFNFCEQRHVPRLTP